MIDGFSQSRVICGDVTLSVHRAGSGAPLILLHGYPQNHHCWETVAPAFAQHFDVIIPDLRGYGDSDAPPDDADHSTYSKRQMAADIVALMDALGIETTHILGHDRGGRVAYRFALDHPERLNKLGIIEIVPTGDFWDHWNADLALKAYHWTFLAQDAPLPERMISADPAAYIDWTLAAWTLSKKRWHLSVTQQSPVTTPRHRTPRICMRCVPTTALGRPLTVRLIHTTKGSRYAHHSIFYMRTQDFPRKPVTHSHFGENGRQPSRGNPACQGIS